MPSRALHPRPEGIVVFVFLFDFGAGSLFRQGRRLRWLRMVGWRTCYVVGAVAGASGLTAWTGRGAGAWRDEEDGEGVGQCRSKAIEGFGRGCRNLPVSASLVDMPPRIPSLGEDKTVAGPDADLPRQPAGGSAREADRGCPAVAGRPNAVADRKQNS